MLDLSRPRLPRRGAALAVTVILINLITLSQPAAAFGQEAPACSEIGAAAFVNYQNLELQGVEAFQAQDYQAAIKRFETAKSMCDQSQSLIFALGRSYQLAGDCAVAITHYNQALRLLGPKLDSITKRLTEAEAQCKDRPGTLAVICEQPGVMLSINGQPAVACPLTTSLPVGAIVISAARPDFEPVKVDAQIQSGETSSVRIPTLKAIPKIEPPPPMPPPDNTMDIIGWSLIGGGALLIGGGIGFYAWGAGLQSDFQGAKDSVNSDNIVQNGLSRPQALALQDDIDTSNIMGATLVGIGSAALITGVVLWSLPNTETKVSVSPSAGAGQFITIQGTF